MTPPTLLAALLSMSAVVSTEMIFEDPPHSSCHASTIEWTDGGLVVAWFGGTEEGHDDVGIWLSRHGGRGWSSPREVARDAEHPCWNPVLFDVDDGPLQLYYKVGPSPREWWGMVIESTDAGATWSSPRRLPEGILGPIKNKPVRLGGDVVLSGSSTEHAGWVVHMELSADGGRTWTKTGPLNDGTRIAAIQPTVLPHAEGGVQILCRTRQGRISESRSTDRGLTWSPMTLGELPNPDAGIDAVLLEDGRSLLAYNHTTKGRHSLDLASSEDGRTWRRVLSLEDQEGEYSYPAIIQTPDGLVHITYTHRRRHIKHVVIDPRKLSSSRGSQVESRRSVHIVPDTAPSRRGPRRGRGVGVGGRSTSRGLTTVGLALAASLAPAPAGASPLQIGLGSDDTWCRSETPFWTPLSELSALPPGVRAITVEGVFHLSSGRSSGGPDRFFLRDDRGLERGSIELRPATDLDRDFRDWAGTLWGRRLEVTGCLEETLRPTGPPIGERLSPEVLHFYAYAKTPERKKDHPPRQVELSSLRDGAFEGQRVRVLGVLAGRRHRALPLSARLSDSDWVLASEDAAAWMRGHPPAGEGFRLDPEDADDQGRGLAVVGVVAWWRGAPVLHVESVLLSGTRRRSLVAVLFTLPLDQHLDAAEQTIEVRFSAPMDESSFEGRVELLDASGESVPSHWVYDAELWRLLISPAAAVAAGGDLQLRLRVGILSADGDTVRPESEAGEGLLLMRRYRVS